MFQAEPPSTRSARTLFNCTRVPVLVIGLLCIILYSMTKYVSVCNVCIIFVVILWMLWYSHTSIKIDNACYPLVPCYIFVYRTMVYFDVFMSWYGLVSLLCLILLWIPELGLIWFGITFMLDITLDPRVWFGLVLSGMVWYCLV